MDARGIGQRIAPDHSLALCAAAWLIFGVMVTACDANSARTTPASHAAALGDAVASQLEALPVPRSAVLLVAPTTQTPGRGYIYAAPTGVSLGELNAWYARRLPVGAAWQGWQPCSVIDSLLKPDGGGIQRTWQRNGRVLTVATSIATTSVHGAYNGTEAVVSLDEYPMPSTTNSPTQGFFSGCAK